MRWYAVVVVAVVLQFVPNYWSLDGYGSLNKQVSIGFGSFAVVVAAGGGLDVFLCCRRNRRGKTDREGTVIYVHWLSYNRVGPPEDFAAWNFLSRG